MSHIHDESKFVSWVHQGGRVEFPDSNVLFKNLLVLNVGDVSYIVAEYHGNEVIGSALQYNDYFDVVHRADITAGKIAHIKQAQAATLDALEGTPEKPGLWQRKYIEEITLKDSFDRYDDLMRKKAHVINKGNKEELLLDALSPDDLINYQFTVDLDEAPEIRIRRLTVGAFLHRFTDEENNNFDIARQADPRLQAMLNSMSNRSHIHLDNQIIIDSLGLIERAGLLADEPLDSAFESRVEEVLRDGDADEQYRVISYI